MSIKYRSLLLKARVAEAFKNKPSLQEFFAIGFKVLEAAIESHNHVKAKRYYQVLLDIYKDETRK